MMFVDSIISTGPDDWSTHTGVVIAFGQLSYGDR